LRRIKSKNREHNRRRHLSWSIS